MFEHRPNDLPRHELERKATQTIEAFAKRGMKVLIYFKFTCIHCGARNGFHQPNTLFERGTCSECQKETVILFGGFAVEGFIA